MFTARRRMAQAMFENPSLILGRALTYRYEDSGTREVVTYLGGYMPLELTCAAYAPNITSGDISNGEASDTIGNDVASLGRAYEGRTRVNDGYWGQWTLQNADYYHAFTFVYADTRTWDEIADDLWTDYLEPMGLSNQQALQSGNNRNRYVGHLAAYHCDTAHAWLVVIWLDQIYYTA